jgi:hypothetical protein
MIQNQSELWSPVMMNFNDVKNANHQEKNVLLLLRPHNVLNSEPVCYLIRVFSTITSSQKEN